MTETSKSTLYRMYSDGELDPEQTVRMELELREHAQAAGCVQFERKLRERVCVVMTTEHPTAPQELAGRIRDQIRSVDPVDLPPAQAPSGPIRRLFRGPRHANAFAVAASLALVAGAILVGIFAPPIDAWRAGSHGNQTRDAATHVAQEHAAAAAAFEEVAAAGFTHQALQTANATLGGPFGRPLQIADLDSLGYEFVGASQCEVPHCDSACHYLFKRSKGLGLVSLHIVPDRGQFDMTEGMSIASLPLGGMILPKREDCPMEVVVFSDGELAYLLVVCVADDLPQVAQRLQVNLLASAGSP